MFENDISDAISHAKETTQFIYVTLVIVKLSMYYGRHAGGGGEVVTMFLSLSFHTTHGSQLFNRNIFKTIWPRAKELKYSKQCVIIEILITYCNSMSTP